MEAGRCQSIKHYGRPIKVWNQKHILSNYVVNNGLRLEASANSDAKLMVVIKMNGRHTPQLLQLQGAVVGWWVLRDVQLLLADPANTQTIIVLYYISLSKSVLSKQTVPLGRLNIQLFGRVVNVEYWLRNWLDQGYDATSFVS